MLCAALMTVLTACGPSPEAGRPAGASPGAGTAASATNDPGGLRREFQEDLLKDKLGDRLFKPYRPAQDSLEGILPAPPAMPQRALSPAESRRLKEVIARNRNWSFDAPAKTGPDSDASQNPALGENAGLERDTLALLKRYHEQSEAKRLSFTNTSARSLGLAGTGVENDPGGNQVNDPTALRRTGEPSGNDALKAALDPKSFGKLKVPEVVSLFAPVFSPTTALPLERVGADELRRSDFRKLLEGGSSGAGLSSDPLIPSSISPPGLTGPDNPSAGGNSLPTMSTLPGYKPDFGGASSLSPAVSRPAPPNPLLKPEPPRMSEFNQPTGPPRRQF